MKTKETKKEKIVLNGLDYVGTKMKPHASWKTKHIASNYDAFEQKGGVISFNAAMRMVPQYWHEQQKNHNNARTQAEKDIIMNKTAAVDFSKRILLLILSQKDCEGIRFYIGNCPDQQEPDNLNKMKVSLVLVGTDKDGNDLPSNTSQKSIFNKSSKKSSPSNSTIIAEVGGHRTLAEMINELELSMYFDFI